MLSSSSSFFQKNHRLIFYSAWLLINLVQAATTELFDDEAYYWVYSRYPDWGYFDHPPGIAMLIKAGYALFPNELGVRLFSLVLTTAAIWLVEQLIEKKDALLFYAICASLILAQIGGLLAVPDTPLMFFVALFFWLYRRFLQNMNLANTLFMTVGIALMLYTKYHAVLVVLFTVLSHVKILRTWQPYLILALVSALFIPHLYWQHTHGYPSLQFHLFERNAVDYKLMYSIEFILAQIVLAGPFIGWLLILAALRYKPLSMTHRALQFTFVGIYLFFLLSTLKGKAEANWTIPAFIGLIVLSHQYLTDRATWKKWLYYSVPFTLAAVLFIRVIMMINLPPAWWLVKDEFHENRQWVDVVRQKAGDLPVVFLNSYQKPSKYSFYSGIVAMSLNSIYYRRNNYNFWEIEDSLMGKPVYAVGNVDHHFFTDTLQHGRLENNAGKKINEYYSFSKVLVDKVETTRLTSGKITIAFRSISPENYLPYFQKSPYDTCALYLTLYQDKQVAAVLPMNMTVKDITKREQFHFTTMDLSVPSGKYIAKISISNCIAMRPSINSSGFDMQVLQRR